MLQLLWLEKLQFPEDKDVGDEDGYGLFGQIAELPRIERVDIRSDNYTNHDFVKLLTQVAGVQELCLKMPISRFLLTTSDLPFFFPSHIL